MILGIESSCDDSSLALINSQNLKLEFYKKITQEEEHAKYGGVVPELAARLHTEALPKILKEIKPYFKDIKAIAVTNEPGLSVSLIGGVSIAKALSISLKIPLIAINHLIGHIYSLFLNSDAIFPLGVLLVSGGHTLVLDINSFGEIKILASTTDDSFGESFDKVAKMLDLGYPGGAKIERLAKNGEANFNFTVPLKFNPKIEYSFSGLKNQVRVKIEELKNNNLLNKQSKADICASFQKIACDHILDKLSKIYKEKKFKNFGVVGGASANLYLREKIENLCKQYNSNLLFAPLEFCSDNAAMIARVGVEKYKLKQFINHKDLQIIPNLNLKNARSF